MCCRQIHKHRNTKAKVYLNTRERVGESLTSSTLSNFSKYLCLSKIPKKTFSWQSIFAMIPTAISLTLQELIIKQDIEIVYKLRATLIDVSMPLSNVMMWRYLQLHIKTFNNMSQVSGSWSRRNPLKSVSGLFYLWFGLLKSSTKISSAPNSR